MVKQTRIGVIGGTFNPIHLGHLMIAEVAREEFLLEKVLFVPSRIPPHKSEGVIPAEHRYAMTVAGVADNPYFEVSDVEMKRDGFSYTIETILHLKSELGDDCEIYFIAGTDTIMDLPNWKSIDEVLESCHFIGAIRPNGNDNRLALEEAIRSLGPRGKDKIHLLTVPEMKLSSTYLRDRLQRGKSIRYMVPKLVADYIESHDIYQKE
ncbi:nicotinate-nucleotide adenylyltransferase [Veillonella agrestimuris]|uniref:nicotinate-nucleotide adenylyltransferase n=1 Tax=Veillonella agrestimuris TaxID=2941340 RepID=UPI00203E02C0|nr:nicotinate-nucleotide adenylyltransferase [Veillonella agrestimuris]